jgi:hypothetical protein
MFQDESDQAELLGPASHDGPFNEPLPSLEHGNQLFEQNALLTTIGQATYELHDFLRYLVKALGYLCLHR